MGAVTGSILGGPIGGIVGSQTGGGSDPAKDALWNNRPQYYTDPGPKPEYAQYQNIRDPNTGLLSQPGLNVNLNTQGLDAIRQQALAAPGTSAWSQMMLQKQGLDQASQTQNAAQAGAARAADSRSQLARRGGLSSGAAERNSRSSMRDILGAQQQVGAQGAQARADIGLQGEQQRLAQLQSLPGMELQALQPQQFNIQNALQQKQAEEAAKLAQYQEQMKAYSAAQQANAIGASGPQHGGLLGGLFG